MIPGPPAPPPRFPAAAGARVRAWIARHPVVFVALLSPGIVEYLSGSSQLAGLVVVPPLFFLFLAANLGLYVPGVLLIREARNRWRGGWGTVLLLGCAYAIVEEGLALSTLFNPHAGVVGGLGFYGHFLGVSWVWLVGVVAIHVVYSISLPILLLDLALPARRATAILSRRGIVTTVGILAATTLGLMAITAYAVHFFLGVPLVLGSLAAVAALVLLAYRLPAGTVVPARALPTAPPYAFALLGLSFWVGIILFQALLGTLAIPAAVTTVGLVLVLLGYLFVFLRTIGERENQRHRIALAAGLVAPLMFVGAIVQLHAPVVLVADGAAIWFFAYLWRRYRSPSLAGSSVPAAVAT
jgi:hypothetical protein